MDERLDSRNVGDSKFAVECAAKNRPRKLRQADNPSIPRASPGARDETLPIPESAVQMLFAEARDILKHEGWATLNVMHFFAREAER